MKKFLNIIESNLPDDSIDDITEFKRTLQRLMLKNGIRADSNFGQDYIVVEFNGKQFKVTIEATTAMEDGEDLYSTAVEKNPNASRSVKSLGQQIDQAARAATAKLRQTQAKLQSQPAV